MNIAINTIILLLFLLVHILRTIHTAHMFQLNSYKNNTQLKWFVKNKAEYFKESFLFVIGISLTLFIQNTIICEIGTIVILAASVFFNIPQKAKKPLVYTNRIKRMFGTDLVLALLFSLPVTFLIEETGCKCVLLFLFVTISPFILILSNLINKPLESSINRYYINDAKKIINSHESLITIGVTGSYGKTSVKFILGTLLEAKYNVLVTPESFNTTLGVTKTIRNYLRATHDVFVCEMGAKNVGEIKEICDIVKPKHGIITSVGPQHLESFKSLDNVKKTKFELADSLDTTGKLFLNGEDDNIRSVDHPHASITYGFSDACDYYADNLSVTSAGTSFIVHHKSEQVSFTIPLLGAHNVINVLGGIAVCCELGIDIHRLPMFARKIQPVEHRLQLSRRGKTTIIDDAYNSNPSGVKAAMDVLALFEGYKIVITPGMVELGCLQEEENYKFGAIMSTVCDFVFLVGKKQTEPIYNGLVENGYEKAKIFVTDNLNDAIDKAFTMNIPVEERIILFENDLPDNY